LNNLLGVNNLKKEFSVVKLPLRLEEPHSIISYLEKKSFFLFLELVFLLNLELEVEVIDE